MEAVKKLAIVVGIGLVIWFLFFRKSAVAGTVSGDTIAPPVTGAPPYSPSTSSGGDTITPPAAPPPAPTPKVETTATIFAPVVRGTAASAAAPPPLQSPATVLGKLTTAKFGGLLK